MVNKWKIYEKLKKKSANIEVKDDSFKSYDFEDNKVYWLIVISLLIKDLLYI